MLPTLRPRISAGIVVGAEERDFVKYDGTGREGVEKMPMWTRKGNGEYLAFEFEVGGIRVMSVPVRGPPV
jgi:hypothetical protein